MRMFTAACIFIIVLFVSIDNLNAIVFDSVDEYIPIPGECGRMARLQSNTRSSKIISNVPAYTWSFGCSPTVGAMLAGYYDRNGYPNLWIPETPISPHFIWGYEYFAPSTNAQWTIDWASSSISEKSICPISESEEGVLHRTIRGGADDYWHHNGQVDPYDDPCQLNNWPVHDYYQTNGRCVADFMGTSQHEYLNPDGGTHGRVDSRGIKIKQEALPPGQSYKEHYGCLGIADFIESAGYSIDDCFDQSKNEYYFIEGDTTIEYGGFSYLNLKEEIDADRPVMLFLTALNNTGSAYTSHEVLAIGYNHIQEPPQRIVYFYDTYDYMVHTMDWVGRYPKGTKQYQIAGATVVKLETPSIPEDRIVINCNDIFDDDTFSNEVIATLIDESPMWSNPNSILYWDFYVTLYHSEGQHNVYHEGQSSTSPYTIPFYITSLSFYNYQWVRDIYGNVRGDIMIRAYDHAGHLYECSKQIGVRYMPDAPEILYFDQWDNIINLNLKNDGATSYYIHYGNENGIYNGTGAMEGDSPVLFNAWDDIKLTGLTPNTTWHIAIQGYNELGSNALSQDYPIFVQDFINAPTNPISEVSDSVFTLAWAEVTRATGYKVYSSETPDVAFELWTNIARVTTPYYEFGTNGITQQFFRVVAVNSAREVIESSIVPTIKVSNEKVRK